LYADLCTESLFAEYSQSFSDDVLPFNVICPLQLHTAMTDIHRALLIITIISVLAA